jgi:hypothetical protein
VEYVDRGPISTYENRQGWKRGNEMYVHIELNIEEREELNSSGYWEANWVEVILLQK